MARGVSWHGHCFSTQEAYSKSINEEGRLIAHRTERRFLSMKRLSIWIACLGLVLMTSTMVPNAQARTSVSIGLNFGDRYDGPEPYWRGEPRVVIVPGTHVYYVSDTDYDVYRYGRFWYMNSDGRWYRSRSYRGPWIYVGYRVVPSEISYVPPRYRRHWRDFRDDNIRYGSYRDRRSNNRRYYDRNQDYRSRDLNGDGRIDWRDR